MYFNIYIEVNQLSKYMKLNQLRGVSIGERKLLV